MCRQLILLAVLSLTLLLCNARAYFDDEDQGDLGFFAEFGHNHKHGGFHEGSNDDNGGHSDNNRMIKPNKRSNKKHSKKHSKRGGSGLTEAQKQAVVDIHNAYRRGEGASDMQMLKYSDLLAQLAQDWSDRCSYSHRSSDSYKPSEYGFSSVGENMWASTGKDAIPDKPIADWFIEKTGYNYNTKHCSNPPCGHYTAVVWASTTEVGCGLTKCPKLRNSGMKNAYFVVCNYGPAGNWKGELAYKKGPSCSECSTGQFFCSNNLCDSSCTSAGRGDRCQCKARCGYGSITSDCKCRCNSGYIGMTCSERCENKDPMCGANPGWPIRWCKDPKKYKFVYARCPKMCGICV